MTIAGPLIRARLHEQRLRRRLRLRWPPPLIRLIALGPGKPLGTGLPSSLRPHIDLEVAHFKTRRFKTHRELVLLGDQEIPHLNLPRRHLGMHGLVGQNHADLHSADVRPLHFKT